MEKIGVQINDLERALIVMDRVGCVRVIRKSLSSEFPMQLTSDSVASTLQPIGASCEQGHLSGDTSFSLEQVAHNMGVPYEEFPSGLSQSQIYIENKILEWRFECERNEMNERLSVLTKDNVDYLFIFNKLLLLTSITEESFFLHSGARSAKPFQRHCRIFGTGDGKFELEALRRCRSQRCRCFAIFRAIHDFADQFDGMVQSAYRSDSIPTCMLRHGTSKPSAQCHQIYAQTMDNECLIYIRDSGVGISIENQNKKFQLNCSFSTFGTNNEHGTGLGL